MIVRGVCVKIFVFIFCLFEISLTDKQKDLVYWYTPSSVSPSLSPSLPPSLSPSGIRSLQCILLKICLLLGVTIHTGVEFREILEPDETRGWHAKVGQQLIARSTTHLFCSHWVATGNDVVSYNCSTVSSRVST